VLAGDICTVLALVILSSTLSETLDDAAPTIASALALSSLSVSLGAMSGEPSPESAWVSRTSLPSTPPAWFISWIASSTPATSGGPRKARSPVSGSSVPIVSWPLPWAAGGSGHSC
jgi:hypothetical protein